MESRPACRCRCRRTSRSRRGPTDERVAAERRAGRGDWAVSGWQRALMRTPESELLLALVLAAPAPVVQATVQAPVQRRPETRAQLPVSSRLAVLVAPPV